MPLPPFPGIELVAAEAISPRAADGFLRLRRHRFQATFPGGETSAPFVYDSVDRAALDAVVVVAHARLDPPAGRHVVYLRSALRPPCLLRAPEQRPIPEKDTLGALWEVVAGLVESDECSPEGLVRCAARELAEELGFEVSPADILPLGGSVFPCPGVIGERHHYFHVEVDPDRRGVPSEDGSALERGAAIVAIPLDDALDAVRRGVFEDAKTELALRRLAEISE